MDHHENLLPIGLFSQLTTISVRMLRHYQEQEILTPAAIDSFTGYRYYGADQVLVAQWIVNLRNAGFSIPAIREILERRDDPERVHAILATQRHRLEIEKAQLKATMAAFDTISSYLKESTMEITVRTTEIPTMTVASLRRILPSYNDEGILWNEIGPLMEQSGVEMPDHHEGLGGATFHDPDYRESDVDVEIWLQVSGPFTATAPLKCVEMPAQKVAVATLIGSYDGMAQVSAALGAYIAQHNLHTGSMFSIYRVSPAQNPDPSSWVTDVCLPLLQAE